MISLRTIKKYVYLESWTNRNDNETMALARRNSKAIKTLRVKSLPSEEDDEGDEEVPLGVDDGEVP